MIKSFKHKGLKQLYEDDDRKGLNSEHIEKLRRILSRLDQAKGPSDLDLPGYKLHSLKGDLSGYWSVTVRANWRVVFRFEQGNVIDVNFIDYH